MIGLENHAHTASCCHTYRALFREMSGRATYPREGWLLLLLSSIVALTVPSGSKTFCLSFEKEIYGYPVWCIYERVHMRASAYACGHALCKCTYGDQKLTLGVVLSCSLPRCFEIGSRSEPEAHQLATLVGH